MKKLFKVISFLSLLLGGQFTLTAMAQGDLNRVVNGNLRMVEQNHMRGDRANDRAYIHNIIFHDRYGYGYYDYDDSYFYGTDQYGRGSRGRVRVSPTEVGVGGVIIGGAIGGWKGAAIGGVGGYFGTKAIQAIVQHKGNKKAEQQAEAMAVQQQTQYEASLERKLVRNLSKRGSVRVRIGPDIVATLAPGSEKIILVPEGMEPWFEGLWENPRTGREEPETIGYGKGKTKLPQNSGWVIFDPNPGN